MLFKQAYCRKYHLARLLMSITALALLSACAQELPSNPAEVEVTVSVYEIGPTLVNREARFHGRVVPADFTRVAFRVAGKVELLAVQSGQQVVAGQVIAKIESTIQEQILNDARAQYELSRRQLERAEELADIGAITPARRDELNASFRLATANLKLAEAGMTYTVIKAPFAGTIVDVNKELFESVMPGETIATMYRNDRTDVLINIPDGLPARIHQMKRSDAYNPKATFSGSPQVYAMRHLKHSTARNPRVEAFQIWLTMPVTDPPIPPGVPVTVTVDLQEAGFSTDSGVRVPVTALQAGDDQQQFRVWLYENGTVHPVPISIRRMAPGGALVSGNLQAGDLVVTSGLFRLRTGQAVTVVRHEQEL